ncbi:MAG: winged helix-turn-helix transcriptional regulator [Candidatus Omnitrophica bacterium]|nr:winged helix-turn-helix transcriptional regulator [Candidatus Omnitrophota bacterium]
MITEYEKILKVLSDQNRIRIVKLLEKQKLCVCELAFVLAIKQPSVSRHLKKLKGVGLIKEEQDSFWTNYVLTIKGHKHLITLIRTISAWLNDDDQIKEDLKRLRQADRTQLCCS